MDYPSNSNKERKNDEEVDEKKPGKPEQKKVERVTTGEVVRRKPPLGKRFKETFVGGDTKGVFTYVVMDVLVPAAKDMVSDATSEAVQRMLFGDSRSSRRGRNRSPNGYVSYNRYGPSSANSSRPAWERDRDEPRQVSRRARATHDFDEIILQTRGEAEEVIDRLFDLISKYEQASVTDLYELTGINGSYTDDKWGWHDIRGAGASRVKGGYLLDLPRPEPLD